MRFIIKLFITLFLLAGMAYIFLPMLKTIFKEPDNLIIGQEKLLSNYKLSDPNL